MKIAVIDEDRAFAENIKSYADRYCKECGGEIGRAHV